MAARVNHRPLCPCTPKLRSVHGRWSLALPFALSEGRLSTKPGAVLGQRDPILSLKSSFSLNISPNTFLKMGH